MQHFQPLADSAMETGFQPGQWIYRQGDPANRFYLILEGKVIIESEVVVQNLNATQQLLMEGASRETCTK
jgi:cyclic nucleotide-binding protein